jgi:hypothetical protein
LKREKGRKGERRKKKAQRDVNGKWVWIGGVSSGTLAI